ncbi:uncharacterized protein TNCV_4866301 [Trichonephila clavipes]|nr:uncharacterized protein TNCV_4866301 [Trichonephila clavipes]
MPPLKSAAPDRDPVCPALEPPLARLTTRGRLATDHVILKHGQVTWTTPELAPPLLTTKPHQREDISALNRFSVHRYPTRRVFSDWYWARTRDKASHDPIPIPLGYRGRTPGAGITSKFGTI